MIKGFFGGVKEPIEIESPVSAALGCGCYCNCPDRIDSVNGPTTMNTDLNCQPLPKFIYIGPIPH